MIVFAQTGPKLPKLDEFSGKESELESWLSRSEAILRCYTGVSLFDGTSCDLAALFLKGKARDMWDYCTNERGDPRAGCMNWAQFAALLRDLLGPRNTDVVGRARLRDLHQTGSVRSYAQEFLRIVRTMRRPMADYDLRELFIGHLK